MVEEILYPAMEDSKLDLMIGEGPAARSIRIDLPPFTLVGATTRAGLITTPLRERFGIPLRLEFYDVDDLQRIVRRGAALLGMALAEDGAREIAARARGTPRVAIRLLRRVRDFAAVAGADCIDREVPTPRCCAWRSTAAASMPPTGATCAASPSSMAAVRSASKPWQRRWPRSGTPSKT